MLKNNKIFIIIVYVLVSPIIILALISLTPAILIENSKHSRKLDWLTIISYKIFSFFGTIFSLIMGNVLGWYY